MRHVTLALLLALAPVAAGCGGGARSAGRQATVLLDFTPNAVHAGIYTARARSYDEREGVRLLIRVPGASTDAVRLLASGRVDFAVLDIHDLALARTRGSDLVGVMALVQRPLAAVIAQPGTRSPRALQGRTVGVTGVPSDVAVLRSEVLGAGGDPRRVATTTIGFNAVTALLAHRVDAATAFWDVEGVALERRRRGFRIFKVDDYGAPAYPELVLCATRTTVRDRRGLVDRVVRAIERGYREALRHPAASVSDLMRYNPGLDRGLIGAELDAVHSAFRAPGGGVGQLDPGRLRAWARWEARFGIVARAPDVTRAFLLG
jgi:putative hydroxymethylpyrimidine transport system substrate-binding protein